MPAFSQLFADPMAAIGYGLLTSGQNPVGAAMGVMQQAEASKAAQEDAEFRKLMMQYKMEQAMNPKPSQAVLPDGSIALVNKRAGTYTLARPEGMEPMQQPQMPYQPAQQAAPISGGIQSRELSPMDPYSMDSGQMPQLADLLREPPAGNIPPPPPITPPAGMMPRLPEYIPDTVGQPQQVTQLPRPAPTGNMAADQKALQDWQAANLRLQEQSAGVLTPEKQIEQRANMAGMNAKIAEAEDTIRLVDEMVGSKDGKIKQHRGFTSVVGAADPISVVALKGWGVIPGMPKEPIGGTEEADFMARFNQTKEGKAFLQAFELLKGGGQITEVEGNKAQGAITRMGTAQSEKEFVAAAREYQDAIRIGIQKLREQGAVGQPSMQPYTPQAPSAPMPKFLGFE